VRELTRRQREILSAIVTDFTATGEPVSSGRLSQAYGFDLSPATLRNVMAELERDGYLEQPHKSAGRVPTEAAFRFFIDALMRLRELSATDAARIAGWYGALPRGADIHRATGRLLSEMSGTAAVLVRPRIETRQLDNLRLVITRPGQVLCVLVLTDGAVENRLIGIGEELINDGQLERLHNLLREVVPGRTLHALRDYFQHSLAQREDELRSLLTIGASLVSAMIGADDRRTDLIVEGRAQLFDNPLFTSHDRLRDVLDVLEDHQRLLALLNEVIAFDLSPRVLLGGETHPKIGYPLSLVAVPYRDESGQTGALGVVGPMPMNYPVLVPLVHAVADAMTASLCREGRAGNPRRPSGLDD
jgi:heat-inducible transcriptional repressor